MARVLALGLSLFGSGLLLVGAVVAAWGLILIVGSEPENTVAAGLLLVSSVVWAASATLNAASLLTDSPRVTRRPLHAFNVASLILLAIFAFGLFATDTASRVELAILALPAVSIPFGYWQAAKRRDGIV